MSVDELGLQQRERGFVAIFLSPNSKLKFNNNKSFHQLDAKLPQISDIGALLSTVSLFDVLLLH